MHIILLNYPFSLLTLRLTNVTFYVSMTAFWIIEYHLLMSIWILVRTDHPANTKCGSVCIYFQKSLPLRIFDIQFLHECIYFEMRIKGKVCNFISLYRSQNQSLEESETFTFNNHELNLDKIAKSNPF